MDTRLEIAAGIVASGPCRVEKALEIADALIAAHEASKPVEPPALPDDAPVMEWEVGVGDSRGCPRAAARAMNASIAGMSGDSRIEVAADLPAVRAAATAYSAAKGFRAVFTGEGAAHDR